MRAQGCSGLVVPGFKIQGSGLRFGVRGFEIRAQGFKFLRFGVERAAFYDFGFQAFGFTVWV